MGGVLGAAGWRVLELVEGSGNVAGHGDVTCPGVVVPCQGEAEVFSSCPVGSDDVLDLEGREQILGVGAADALDTKVINNKGEEDATGRMAP